MSAEGATDTRSKRFNTLLSTMPGNTWVQIDGTKLKAILDPKNQIDPDIRAIVGQRAIVTAWNGAVWIEDLQRLDIVSAGGHGDYCGNEYSSFSLENLQWSKIRGASSMEGYDFKTGRGLNGDIGIMSDGTPASRHTYQGQVYYPPDSKIYMFSGSLCSGSGVADNNWWSVTLDGKYELLGTTGRWEALGDTALYDPITKNIYRSKRNNILEFDVSNRQLKFLTSRGDQGWGAAAAIDSSRRTIFTYGHGLAFSYDLDQKTTKDLSPTGDTRLLHEIGNGLVYVPTLDRYIAWRQGGEIYSIHPETWHISVLKIAGQPPSTNKNGVYGRFAYSEKYGVFIVLAGFDQDMHILKLDQD